MDFSLEILAKKNSYRCAKSQTIFEMHLKFDLIWRYGRGWGGSDLLSNFIDDTNV